MRRRWGLIVPAVLLIAGTFAGVSAAAPVRHQRTDTVAATPALSPPPIPTKGAYLGSYVWPDSDTVAAGSKVTHIGELADTDKFDAVVQKPIAIDNSFVQWNAPVQPHTYSYPYIPIIGDLQFNDAQQGSIPMISWECDTDGNQQIIDGTEDRYIRFEAQQVKNYAHPVFIRLWWEMNLTGLRNEQCLGGLGAAGYIQAWQHVVNIFRSMGATNAAFAWVVAGRDPGADADQFYPGGTYVDWVGEDGYARNTGAGSTPTPFADIFDAFYSEWKNRKPIVIAETGIEPDRTNTPKADQQQEQATWLAGMFSSLQNQFPDIHAVNYWDDASYKTLADGSQQVQHDYRLAGQSLTAFATGRNEPYFSVTGPAIPFGYSVSTTVTANAEQPFSRVITTVGFPSPVLTVSQSTLPSTVGVVSETALNASSNGVSGAIGLVAADTGTAAANGLRPNELLPGISTFVVKARFAPVSGAATQDGTTTFTLEASGAPVITSPAHVDSMVGVPMARYHITTASYPTARLKLLSPLPANFHFTSDGQGGGYLTGTPKTGQSGLFPLALSALSLGSNGRRTYGTQQLDLQVDEGARVITTDAVAAYTGKEFTYSVGTSGYPLPIVSLADSSGPLPTWLHLTTNSKGVAVLSGVPTKPYVFTVKLKALTEFGDIPGSTESSYTSLYYLIVTVH
jgi:hypothetical protein